MLIKRAALDVCARGEVCFELGLSGVTLLLLDAPAGGVTYVASHAWDTRGSKSFG